MKAAERKRLAQILMVEGVEPSVRDFHETTGEGSFETWHEILSQLRAEDQELLADREIQRQVMVLKALSSTERPLVLQELSIGLEIPMRPLVAIMKRLLGSGLAVQADETHYAVEDVNAHDLADSALRVWRLATCGPMPAPPEALPLPPPDVMPSGPWFDDAFAHIATLRAQLQAHSAEINGEAPVIAHALLTLWNGLRADGIDLDRRQQALRDGYQAQRAIVMRKLGEYQALVTALLDPRHPLRVQQAEAEELALDEQADAADAPYRALLTPGSTVQQRAEHVAARRTATGDPTDVL